MIPLILHTPPIHTHTHTPHPPHGSSIIALPFFFFFNLRMMYREQLQSTKDESMDVTLVKGNPISQVRWDKKERKKATEAITAH